MARLIGKYLIGSIGNVTYKKVKKQQIVSAKVVTVKQTKATKRAAGIFGKASSLSRTFRLNTSYLFDNFQDGNMVNRMNKITSLILRQCFNPKTKHFEFKLDSFDLLRGFDFNINSPFRKYWWTIPKIELQNQQLRIYIPPFSIDDDLKFPENATSCSIYFMFNMYGIDKQFKKTFFKNLAIETLTIAQDQAEFVGKEWTFDVPEGCIILCAAGIGYYKEHEDIRLFLNHKTLNPAALLDVYVTEGSFTDQPELPWASVGL